MAKENNYAARSAFKLEEIDQRWKILKNGQYVLDLGSSPGSWSQYASKKIGPQGQIIGIDLQPMTVKLPNALFIVADIFQFPFTELLSDKKIAGFDVVLSDMAPKTTGIKLTDQARSLELCEKALEVAVQYLQPGGTFVCKLFHSDDFANFRDKMKKHFLRVEAIKPDSTRKMSKEIFLVGLKKH